MRKNKVNKLTKTNVFDFAIIIIAVALVVCTYLNVYRQKISLLGEKSHSAYVTVTANAKEVDATLSSLEIGDKFFITATNERFGSVKSVEIAETSGVYESKIVFDSKVKYDSNGVFVNGNTFITKGFDIQLDDSDENTITFIIDNIEIR